MSENAHAQTAAKKVAVVVLLTLAPECMHANASNLPPSLYSKIPDYAITPI